MIGVGTTIFLVRPQTFASPVSYLLDTYSAAAAYSLRQLKTGVTNVVRVRRSSDNAESDFSASDITDGTLTTWTGANDGFVTKLYNQGTGSTIDMIQTTAGFQPRLVSSGVVDTKNGLPALYFDGSDVLSTESTTESYQTYPFTNFTVGSNESSASVGPILNFRETSSPFEGLAIWLRRDGSSNGAYIQYGAGAVGFNYLATDNTNSQRLQTFNIDSSGNGEFFLNSVSQSTNASVPACVPATATNMRLGHQPQGSFYLTGYIQEAIWYNSDEDANRTDIESDINTYYSIY